VLSENRQVPNDVTAKQKVLHVLLGEGRDPEPFDGVLFGNEIASTLAAKVPFGLKPGPASGA
jgi:hypothetical protein